MCGIAGFTTKQWRPDLQRIRAATATLIHRGPDEQGVHQSQLCSLGATRLKIQDLHAGDQPVYSPDGDSVIVFNGEVYNHLEVRRELEALGHRFDTHCDTETVLHAFLEWDTACLERFRGMFAFAVWTESKRRLVLVRDRLGIKPLYITRLGTDLLFGSELKAIFAHPEVKRELSLSGLDSYLALNYVPCPWTLIDGIEKVPPGHWLEWLDGRQTSAPYWSLPTDATWPQTLDDAKQELDTLLDQAVREHLLSDVPLGVWLSGGVDSSTILHYAAQATGRQLQTYSITFQGRSFDESSYIQTLVDAYGTDHHQLDLNTDLALESAIEELTYYSDEPMADSGALPVWYLSKLCKTGCTVAFSGEGADEIFGGYQTYQADRVAAHLRHAPRGALRLALAGLRRWPASNEKISAEYKLKRLLEGTLMPSERAHVFWNGTFSDAEKAELLHVQTPAALAQVLAGLRGCDPAGDLAPYLRFDQQYYLPDDILVKSDRMSMAHSVEVRPPFLDHRIVEFAARLPMSLKIRGTRQKYILKKLMGPRLPPEITRHGKVGFDIPAHEWFRGALRPIWLDTLADAKAQYGDVFRFDTIERLTELHMTRRLNVGYHLWGLLTLFLWMKRWNVQVAQGIGASMSLEPAVL